MDFFTVITANFRIVYGLFLIRHSRREIIHFNATEHPTSEWVVQQLREAFPEASDDQYLIFDRDAKFSIEVHQFLGSCGISAIYTSYRSPWQGSCRRELLDHVIPLNEKHLRRLIRDYVTYQEDRIHDRLGKDTPYSRAIEAKPCPQVTVI
jgi:putative transposase